LSLLTDTLDLDRLPGPHEQRRGAAGLRRLNALSLEEARRQLLTCCGASAWAERMAAFRPFKSVEEMHSSATDVLAELSESDWKEAFSRHPRIGATAGAHGWSAQEQRGVDGAAQQVLAELAELNNAYFEKFGYIYIVCASGKSATEMLELLKARLAHDPQTELTIAAAEQTRITHLRLDKLLL